MPRTYHPIKEFLRKVSRKVFNIYVLIALVLAGGIFALNKYLPEIKKDETKPEEIIVTEAEKYYRAIDGVEVDTKEEVFPRNIGIMVENNIEAWPLSGLDKASVVYEVLAESRIPRFLTIWTGDTKAEKIGPVRSARTYYLELIKPFMGPYLHVGGSPDGLAKIKEYGILDFDQFFHDKYFWRDTVRYAPHNVYTSAKLLTELLTEKKLLDLPEFKGWVFKDPKEFTADEKLSLQVKDVIVNYTNGTYQAKYIFDAASNLYQRYQAKEPMKLLDGTDIFISNIIVEEHKHEVYDAIGRRNITMVGEGKAWIFRDGEMTEATWKKPDVDTLTRYYDADTKEIALNRGKTWINVVEPDTFKY